MEVLAVIPARGGSKGLPRKNTHPFLGRPLIWWSIDAARRAQRVTRIVASTDDEEIASVARSASAEVPFLRPPELAGDRVLDLPVFEHVLERLRDTERYEPDVVVHLRPTSPLRPPDLIDEGIDRLVAEPNADSLRVVCEPENNPFKMWRIEGGFLVPLVDSGISEQYNQPRQELPTVYWQIGTLDVIRPRTIMDLRSMSGRHILPMIVDRSLAADIDDLDSLERAEATARRLGFGPS